MSQLTDAEIVAALRSSVPEPPFAPSRVFDVHRRARARRRHQLSAVTLAAVAVVGAGTVLETHHSPSYAALPGAGAAMPGIPASLYRASHLPTVAAGSACPVSATQTFPAGEGFSEAYEGVGDGPFALAGDGRVGVSFTVAPGDAYYSSGWPGTKAIWRISGSYSGPVLVRGARLDGAGGVDFDRYLGAVGQDEAVDGTPFPDLGYVASAGLGAMTYPGAIRVQAPGCYGLQIDGTSFSEVLTFFVSSVHS